MGRRGRGRRRELQILNAPVRAVAPARSRYRHAPALDGVRGVAMVVFMAFHLGVEVFRGAWIGINLFFVLSGFLIVRLLVEEYADRGRIDILAFYRRRARRLLPALFVLLAVVSAWGILLASPARRSGLKGDLLACLGYVMNWRLVASDNSYFGQFDAPSPLKHLWTLAVEEQFYLLVPLLLLLLLRRRWTRATQAAVLLGLAGVSALLTAWIGTGSSAAQAHVYYGTDARAQSLLVGAAFGLWRAPLDGGRSRRRLRAGLLAVAGWSGAVFYAVGFLTIVPFASWMFRGPGMLLSSLFAGALVVACADRRPSLLTRVLGWHPFAYAGRLSYALYLWHWPVHLWLWDLDRSMPTAVHLVLGVTITFVLAAASWELLERRVIRHGLRALVPTRRAARAVVAASCTALLAGALVVGARPAVAGASNDPNAPGQTWVNVIPELRAGQPAYVPPARPVRIAMYGDSVPFLLTRWFPSGNFPGFQPVSLAVPGCDLLDAPIIYPPPLPPATVSPDCTALHSHLTARLTAAHVQSMAVFVSPLLAFHHRIGGRDAWWGDPAFEHAVDAAFDRLLASARAADIGLQIVDDPCRPASATVPNDVLDALRSDPALLDEASTGTRMNAHVRTWAERNQVPVVSLHAAVCVAGPEATVHTIRLFSDGIHFTRAATPMVWGWLAPQLIAHVGARR